MTSLSHSLYAKCICTLLKMGVKLYQTRRKFIQVWCDMTLHLKCKYLPPFHDWVPTTNSCMLNILGCARISKIMAILSLLLPPLLLHRLLRRLAFLLSGLQACTFSYLLCILLSPRRDQVIEQLAWSVNT